MGTSTLTTNWNAYTARYNISTARMKALIERLAERFQVNGAWEDGDTDFGWHIAIRRADDKILDVSLTIWDSGDADDGIYGVHGNFNLDIVETGGRCVGGIVPNNYSDDVWVDYDDDDEWDQRLTNIEASEDDIAQVITEWLAE
jgi:hypothetical protein